MLLCSGRGELLALVLQVCVVVTSSDEARSRMILLIHNQLQVTMTTKPSRITGGTTHSPATPPDPTTTVAHPVKRQLSQNQVGVLGMEPCVGDSTHQWCRRLQEEAHVMNQDATPLPL